jgi:hypothetical protein
MNTCPSCGCEDPNFYYDGDEYWCEECTEAMEEKWLNQNDFGDS